MGKSMGCFNTEEPKHPWETSNIDWVTGLVPGRKESFNELLVIANRYGKGLRDTTLTSKFWTSLYDIFGIKIAFSTAYHPQTDGLAERMIQKMEDIIRRFYAYGTEYKDHEQYTHDWVRLLPAVQLA
ncbi:hypothetical protein O181_096123 [Austropuccinia psidii MF-1]|uniref:Integrase catalytic domain-containing protein n=1 Tax=Austropuccinia psidii MF-1 TaxID=1389203 RepID=A0A9Q3J6D7_9BASI|nr:hypothetical protein [Austropuccinia psidii MF-1]